MPGSFAELVIFASVLMTISTIYGFRALDRLALVGHRAACAPCRRFGRQLLILREACREPGEAKGPPGDEAEGLSEEARSRLIALVRNARTPEDPGAGRD